MANVINKLGNRQNAINTFEKGLNLDLHPITTPNFVLTDNLNGTLITYNGNELCLQNDRGNTQTASLSPGFTSIGAKEHNGIIYIVSVKDNITEIGTYPGVDWTLNETSIDTEPIGLLNYNAYTPLGNLYSGNRRLNAFHISDFYSKETPVTIEVQDSYDGSVNLIIIGGEKTPIIINTGFSVLPDNKYKLVNREQSADTNKYQVNNLAEQLSLIRNSYTVNGEQVKLVNIDLESVTAGGQLKGGNYTFYLKFGDDDYNQTDIVAESGVVSIFNGTDGVPSTISGTLADERTDKMVQLKIDGLNHVYSKLYIYYTREYSDVQGYRMTEAGVLVEPFEMEGGTSQKIWISGFEQTTPIDISELSVDYHTVDWAKAEAQHSNMLFLANIGQEETFDLYRKLRQYTWDHIDTYIEYGSMKVGGGDDFSHANYYSTQNIYYSLGYWPEEWYRFAVVYILKDGSTTPAFNVRGDIFTSVGQVSRKTNDDGVFKTPRADVLSSERPLCFRFVPNGGSVPDSVSGWFVVRQKRIPTTICQGLSINIDKRSYLPLVYERNISEGKGNWVIQSFLSLDRSVRIAEKEAEDGVSTGKGDEKKVVIKEHECMHVLRPLLEIYNKTKIKNTGKKPLSSNIVAKEWKKDIDYRFIKEANNTYFKGCGIVSLDPCVNPSVSDILNGSEFDLVKEYTVDVPYDEANDLSLIFNANVSNGFISTTNSKQAKAVFIKPNTLVKSIDDYNFSNIAGNGSDAGSFKYTSRVLGVYTNLYANYCVQNFDEIGDEIYGTTDYYGYNSTHNVNLIRGEFMPYVGVARDDLNISTTPRGGTFVSGPSIYSIRHKDINNTNSLLVRSQDNSEYYAVTKRLPITQEQIAYRGDCFICKVGMRVLSNFIDSVAPANDVILDPLSWELNVRQKSRWGGDGSGVDGKASIVNYSDVNLSDINAVDLGYWVTFPCLSSYNLGLRSVDSFHVEEMSTLGAPRSFYPLNGGSTASGNKMEESFLLNDGLSGTVGRKRYNLMPDVPYRRSEFANRIIFSNINITDVFYNGYRVFQGASYKDYDKQYGPITKIIKLNSNLLCVMDHGIGLVPINEKALMQTTAGEAIHIYGHGVLPDNMTMISQDYGSKYPHSVIRTPVGIYGIDTDARKIWRYSDSGFRIISDAKIETYLNDNLFTDIQSSIETVDVRTHYNAFKGDLMFTFYNTEKKYISVPSVLSIPIGESKQLNIYSNVNDLEYSIADTEIATLEPDLYIKGIIEGETLLTISGNGIEKTVTIVVVREQDVPESSVDPTFDGLPLSMKANVNDSYIYTLSGTVDPDEVQLEYDESVISVVLTQDQLVITMLAAGNTDLNVTYNGNTITSSIIISEVSDDIEPDESEEFKYITRIEIPSSLEIYVGETKQIVPIVTPENATEKVEWHTAQGYARVDQQGNITPVSDGYSRVVASSTNYNTFCMVHSSYDTPVEINLDNSELIMVTGETYEIDPTITCEHVVIKPQNYSMLSWTSSDESVAKITGFSNKKYIVTAVGPGNATLTCTYVNSEVTATCSVNVLNTGTIEGFDIEDWNFE